MPTALSPCCGSCRKSTQNCPHPSSIRSHRSCPFLSEMYYQGTVLWWWTVASVPGRHNTRPSPGPPLRAAVSLQSLSVPPHLHLTEPCLLSTGQHGDKQSRSFPAAGPASAAPVQSSATSAALPITHVVSQNRLLEFSWVRAKDDAAV